MHVYSYELLSLVSAKLCIFQHPPLASFVMKVAGTLLPRVGDYSISGNKVACTMYTSKTSPADREGY